MYIDIISSKSLKVSLETKQNQTGEEEVMLYYVSLCVDVGCTFIPITKDEYYDTCVKILSAGRKTVENDEEVVKLLLSKLVLNKEETDFIKNRFTLEVL